MQALQRGEVLALSHARVEAGADGARFEVEDDGVATKIVLSAGALRSTVEPLAGEEAYEIITGDARIAVHGTRFWVDTGNTGTWINVEEGRVAIWPSGASVPRIAQAGEHILIARNLDSDVPRALARPPEPKSERPRENGARTLELASEALPNDAPRAAELAERVLESGAKGELEARALAILADAERRRGFARRAELAYARLRDHPRGGPYAEEAMLQRAMLLVELGERSGALEELSRLEGSHPRGATAPERVSLAAKLHLANDDAALAAEVILRARVEGTSLELSKRRIEVARALVELDPGRALELVAGAPASLRAQAEQIAEAARTRLDRQEGAPE
jgi:hypothetical protein